MNEKPYESFSHDEMILRDHLATDRTLLANERTLLAYVRTALAFIITGVGALKFFTSHFALVAGGVFLLLGLTTLIIGFWRFHTINKRYHSLRPPAS